MTKFKHFPPGRLKFSPWAVMILHFKNDRNFSSSPNHLISRKSQLQQLKFQINDGGEKTSKIFEINIDPGRRFQKMPLVRSPFWTYRSRSRNNSTVKKNLVIPRPIRMENFQFDFDWRRESRFKHVYHIPTYS